jgi:hypothetical protein
MVVPVHDERAIVLQDVGHRLRGRMAVKVINHFGMKLFYGIAS